MWLGGGGGKERLCETLKGWLIIRIGVIRVYQLIP